MARPVIAIRPEPGLAGTIQRGQALGLDMHGCALSQVEPVAWDAPDPAGFDAILIGSANALRYGGRQVEAFTHLPVYAVGKSTARFAEQAGFRVAHVGEGGLQNVIESAPTPKRFLRLAGEARIDLDPPHGVTITERVVYRLKALPLPDAACDLLQSPALVLLYSAASAEHFAAECARLDLDRADITLVALGPRIVKNVGKGWHSIHIPDRPNEAELLAIANNVWQ